MNNLRREIVKKAFRSISGQAPKVEKEVLRQAIDTSRHPAVLRGDLRAEEALSQIFDSLPNPVAEKDFLEVYERISDSVQDDSEFYTTVTRTWAMDQKNSSHKDLAVASSIKAGFATSAYHNHRTQAPVDVPASVRVERLSLKIDPVALPKQGVVPKDAQLMIDAPQKTHHRVRTVAATNVTIAAPQEHSTEGKVPTVVNSLGFFVKESSTHEAIGTGEVAEIAMDAEILGKKREGDAARRRHDLQRSPLRTADPPVYMRSSLAHARLNAAVNREQPAQSRTSDAPAVTDLRGVLEQQRADIRGRTTIFRPTSTTLRSTQQEHFAPINTQEALKASQRFSTVPTGQGVRDEVSPRRTGALPTEYSDNMQNRHSESDRVSKNDCRGTFRLVNGIRQMHTLSHHPRPTVTDAPPSPSNVVPEQFGTTQRSAFV
jgi:hypothetical protein